MQYCLIAAECMGYMNLNYFEKIEERGRKKNQLLKKEKIQFEKNTYIRISLFCVTAPCSILATAAYSVRYKSTLLLRKV